MREAQGFGERLQRRTGIGDRNECFPGFVGAQRRSDSGAEIVQEDIGLQSAAGFRGDDKKRVREIYRLVEGPELGGIGAVEHMKLWTPRLRAENFRHNFGAEARSAHPQQHEVLDAPSPHLLRKMVKRAGIAHLLFDDPEPAHPLVFFASRPERRVASPETPDFVLRAPEFQFAGEGGRHFRRTGKAQPAAPEFARRDQPTHATAACV